MNVMLNAGLAERSYVMPRIISVGTGIPEFAVSQNETMEFARQLFSDSVKDLDRLLKVFHNGEIEKRHFVKDMDWYRSSHSFSEKNNAFIEEAVEVSIKAIHHCLQFTLIKENNSI